MADPIAERSPESTPASGVRRRGDFGHTAARELQRLEEAAEQSPNDEMASLELALFLAEHDNAGAFKFEKFGRETVAMFEQGAVESDAETGKFTMAESERNRRVMFVNMGELDRINKDGGGHGAGDAALKETVHVVEQAVLAKIGQREGRAGSFSMLRYRGNEFMVSFADIGKEDFEEVMRSVRDAAPTLPGKDGLEPWPLVADGFALDEAVEILNQVQAELGPDERIDGSDPAEAARELINVMKRRADYSLDTDKYLSRVERVQGKIAAAGDDPAAQAEARAFYENYMKKVFDGAPMEVVAGFSPVDAEQGAFAFAAKGLAEATAFRRDNDAVARAYVRERREKRGDAEPSPAPTGVRLAEIPAQTRGQRELQKAEQAAAAATGGEAEARKAEMRLAIANADRDRGTGLLRRGKYYEAAEQAIAEGRESAMVFVDMGFLRYFDNRGGAEVGNNALTLAADLMERAVDEAGVKGNVYRYGGDEFTILLDGGPEAAQRFTATLEKLRAEAGAVPAGERGTADGYHPTELSFNYGTADTAVAERVFADLQASGHYAEQDLADPGFVANAKAELMTILADKAVEESKAVDRFLFLTDALRDPKYAADPSRRTQVENLIAFSNKAIFADKGGAEFLRGIAASGMDRAQVRAEAEKWFGERVKNAEAQEGRQQDLLNQLVEMHGKIRYYERTLADARHKAESAEARNDRLEDELRKARQEREQLINVRRTLDRAA